MERHKRDGQSPESNERSGDVGRLQDRVAEAHRTSENVRGDAADVRRHAVRAREHSQSLRAKVGVMLAELRRKRTSR
jgi:hypothetical protein